MYIRQDRLHEEFYQRIRGSPDTHTSSLAVAILVALDIDAICSCRMLSAMLKSDYIPHRIHPVKGYADMEQANREFVKGNADLRFIVLLNCGTIVDLPTLLTPEPGVCVFVIDANRPVNLDNVYGEDNGIYVLDDGDIEHDMADVHEAWYRLNLSVQEYGELDDEQSSDDEEHDDDLIDHMPAAHEDRPSDGEGSDAESDASSQPGKRRRLRTADSADGQVTSLRDLRQQRREWSTIVADYYAKGTWKGSCSSALLYAIATSLGKEDNDLLWLAIIGMSSACVFGQQSLRKYLDNYQLFRDEVHRLNTPDISMSTPASGPPPSSRSNGRSPTDMSVRVEDEYRFMLVRHWSLYDAMFHSPYMASKLKLYSTFGVKRLHKLLAKMGFSLQECHQVYTYMNMDLKRLLREKLGKFAGAYGLDEIVFPSFVRCWGFKCTLSASDVCYALSAYLEAGHAVRRTDKKWAGVERKGRDDEGDGGGDDDVEGQEAKQLDEWLQNFHDAYAALADVDKLRRALPIAMSLQRAIIRIGTALIQKRQIRSLRSFRIAVLKDVGSASAASAGDLGIFSHPMMLNKLALWVAEAINDQEREQGKSRHLPFVMACLNPLTSNYLVVGTNASSSDPLNAQEEASLLSSFHGTSVNRFGLAFQQVAAETRCHVKIDSFEASVIECQKDDLGGFLEALSMHNVQNI